MNSSETWDSGTGFGAAAAVAETFDFDFALRLVCKAADAASCGLTDRNWERARVRRGDRGRTIGRALGFPRFPLPVSGCRISDASGGKLGCSGSTGEGSGSSASLSSA